MLTPSSEIDLQVWALLAVVVRDFVASWYGTITNDTELVTEVVKVVGVVVAGVAARVGKVSSESGGKGRVELEERGRDMRGGEICEADMG